MNPIREKIRNTRICATTMVEPTGVESSMEATMPTAEDTTEITAEQITTRLKLLNTRIAESAGNTTSSI